MKSLRNLTVLSAVGAGLLLASAAPANASPSHKVVNFKGAYAGTATLLINGQAVTIQSVKGVGKSTLIGAGTVSAKGTAAGSSECVPFKGTGSMKGAGGTIKFSVSASNSTGCSSGQSGPVTVTVNGKAKVLGGTGKAKAAKGTLTFKGTLNLKDTSGTQSGTFSGTLSGKLTV